MRIIRNIFIVNSLYMTLSKVSLMAANPTGREAGTS
jgi:hypothetical protein